MGFAEYADYDGLGLAELVDKGKVTPLELIDAAIERAERHNPTLNAIVHEAYDEARGVAKGKLPDGPFKGVPFLIKDLGSPVKGWRRSSGSRSSPMSSTTMTARWSRVSAPPAPCSSGRPTRPNTASPAPRNRACSASCPSNPWDPNRISGGSSSGAASAVGAEDPRRSAHARTGRLDPHSSRPLRPCRA